MLPSFAENKLIVQHLNSSIKNLHINVTSISTTDVSQVSKQYSTLVDVFTVSPEKTDYDKFAEETWFLHNVPETSNGQNDKKNADHELTFSRWQKRP